VDDAEKPLYDETLDLLGRIDLWVQRMDPASGHPGPKAGSALEDDDQRVHPYEISHAAWHALSHAVDHLHMLRVALRDGKTINMYAPFTLLRAATENAAAAVWLLAPDNQTERILRRLRFAAGDIRQGEKVKTLLGSSGPRAEQVRLDDLRKIAAAEGISAVEAVKPIGYERIIEAATRDTRAKADLGRFIWRMCSGIAHGDLWATIGTTTRVDLPGAPAGMKHLRVSANMQALLLATMFAFESTALGWQLFDLRQRP
jgi:hypothetical protein